jgi:peptidyl-dipeptidase Dcp
MLDAERMALAGGAGTDSRRALLDPWSGPFGGVPPFDRIRPADFAAALSEAQQAFRAELRTITRRRRPADFANTIAALEDAGRSYDRVMRLLGIYTSTLNDAEMQAIDRALAPVIAAFEDEVIHNARLFSRIVAVYRSREQGPLDAEQRRLVEIYYRRFSRQGAALPARGKRRLAAINQELATLFATFRQNLLGDEEEHALVLEAEADLEGLPASLRTAAAAAAAARDLPGRWLFANTRSAIEPFLVFSARRDLRERAWRMWMSRADNGDRRDNKAVAARILHLRAERARLLGYPTHAHWMTEDNMARTPEAAMALLERVWKAAVVRARDDIAAMQALVDREGGGFRIEAWDHRYYAEKLRRARHDLDQEEIKPYLALDAMVQGMFWAAGRVYGLELVGIDGLPVYHPDVRVYEVRRAGRHVGLCYLDLYARSGKASGAWMNEYRSQERFDAAVTPIVSNNANFIEASPGEPVLVSWDDAVTLFHEFGHALHGLLSNVRYPTLAGSRTVRDFVEFPSLFNEYWLETAELLIRFARHHQTGAPMPAGLIERIRAAHNFNQGFATVEYLASALYDMRIHLAATPEAVPDPATFERELLAEIGCPHEIGMRHRPTGFAHIFAGDDYSAGYYVYLWAEAMTADAHEAFMVTGDPFDPALCRRLEQSIMSVGNSIAPDEAFRRFRGRDVDGEALMRSRGFSAG